MCDKGEECVEKATHVPIRSWIISALCAVIGVEAFSIYLQLSEEITHRFLALAVTAVLTVLGTRLFEQRDARLRRYGWAIGMLFSLAQVCGERVSKIGTLINGGWDWLLQISCVIGFAPAVGGLFALFVRGLQVARQGAEKKDGRRLSTRAVFWGSTAILLLLWLPYLLAFYPGLFTYDVSYQYLQYTTGDFNTHHPLLHTLLVGGFCDLGRLLFGYPSKGILLYTLFQMGLMALSMASANALLHRYRAPVWVCVTLLIIEGIMPFHTLLVISTTKDTLFAGALLYLCVLLLEAILEPQALHRCSWGIRFVLTQMAVGMMRNNGFICLAAVLAVGVVELVRHHEAGKRLIVLTLCGLVMYGAGNAGLKAAVGAQNGPIREILSVPAQQLGRVYALTDDEAKDEILSYFPGAPNYAPSISDPLKDTFTGTSRDLPGLLRLWISVGLRHPIIYMDAFVALNKGFYQLDETPPWGAQYLETKFHESKEDGLLEHSLWPELRDWMTELYSRRGYLSVPIYAALLSHAFWCWLMLWGMTAAMYLKNKAAISIGVVVTALFLTVLLGPCVMLRYIYPIILCGPFLLGTLVLPARRKGLANASSAEG